MNRLIQSAHRHTAIRTTLCAVLGVWLIGSVGQAQAQTQQDYGANGPGIYSCVDSLGRRITADRPIPECLDREQRELSPTGITRRVIPPNLTAEERAREEAKAQQESALRLKQAEEKKRDRALLARYGSQKQHDQERQQQLAVVKNTQVAIEKRTQDLIKQRENLQAELEFYKGDPKKAPAWLQHRVKENAEQIEAQKRLMEYQQEESQRINARFDEELVRLKVLWAAASAAPAR